MSAHAYGVQCFTRKILICNESKAEINAREIHVHLQTTKFQEKNFVPGVLVHVVKSFMHLLL